VKNKVLVLGTAFIFVVVSLLAGLWGGAKAGSGDFQETQLVAVSEENSMALLQAPSSVLSESSEDIAAASSPSETAIPLSIVETANELLALRQSRQHHPGWIWMLEEYTGGPQRGLPNGVIFPDHYLIETWYHVNQELLVDRYVFLERDLDGNILQLAVYSDGQSWSSVFGETVESPPFPVPANLDVDFLPRVAGGNSRSTSSVVQTELEGQQVYKFSGQEWLSGPTKFATIEHSIIGTEVDFFFDANTGLCTRYVYRLILAKDRSTVFYAESLFTIEFGAEPPQEILDLFEAPFRQ
jgi:hypothetical protein